MKNAESTVRQQEEVYELNVEQMSTVKTTVHQLRQELRDAHETNNNDAQKRTTEVDKLHHEMNTFREQLMESNEKNEQLNRDLERSTEKCDSLQQGVEQNNQQVNKQIIILIM